MPHCLQLVYDFHACRGSWKAAAEAQYRLAELLRGQQDKHRSSAELLQQRAAALGKGLPGRTGGDLNGPSQMGASQYCHDASSPAWWLQAVPSTP